MPAIAHVDGADLTISRAWSRRPRVHTDGIELPRDRWDTYQLTSADGHIRPVRVDFDWWQLGPRLRVGDEVIPVGPPVPGWARVALLALAVLGFFAGVVGFVLFFGAAVASAALLRRSQRTTGHVAAAIAVPLLAVIAYILFGVVVLGIR